MNAAQRRKADRKAPKVGDAVAFRSHGKVFYGPVISTKYAGRNTRSVRADGQLWLVAVRDLTVVQRFVP